MIKKLINKIKPWKMIVFDDHREANKETLKLESDGYTVQFLFDYGKWIVTYKKVI